MRAGIVILIDRELIQASEPLMKSKAVFLDRDGVLTRERSDYVKTPDELEVLPGIGPPLRDLRKIGFRLVIVTNQSVVGRGLAIDEAMGRLHETLRCEPRRLGGSI